MSQTWRAKYSTSRVVRSKLPADPLSAPIQFEYSAGRHATVPSYYEPQSNF